MTKLLNRFAWFIAIWVWIWIWVLFWNWFEEYIISIIVIIIIKFLFLSESFIWDRLDFFAKWLINLKENEYNIIHQPSEAPLNTIKEDETIVDLNHEENFKTEDYIEVEKIEIEKKEDEQIKVINEEIKEEKIYIKPENIELTAFDILIEKIWNYIKSFFSTNLLAKLGWILVFLAVVYFLKDIAVYAWEVIWAVWRLIIGIVIWFITYLIWVKIHNSYKNEGIILMWTGILINFAVILAWRYILWDNGYLTEWTTFIFLILNTVFWVLTSMIYNSKTLLIFSFIFAYLNPFIIWAESNGEPYTLIWYSFIISLGALFIAKREKSTTLIILSFILWNLLFLIAPFSDSIWWSAKIILTSIFSIFSIILINKLDFKRAILPLFSGAYLFIILNLLNSWSILSETISFIIYNIIIVILFWFTIKLLNNLKKSENKTELSFVLFIPLLILSAILFSGNLIFTPFVLVSTLIIYLFWFIFLWKISNIFSYIYFSILALFILLFNFDITFNITNLLHTEFITMIISSLLFLFSSYCYSFKKSLVWLFSIWTIWTILILSTIIIKTWNLMLLSVVSISIFAIANLILPLVNSKLLKKENLNILIIWNLVWALFFTFEIYDFWEVYFSGIAEGLAFLGLAIIYFIQWYFVANKLGFDNMREDIQLQNTFYSFIWISISLFSVAVAFVFADTPEIITTVWLFEATILYFFYSKNSSLKIFWAATILFIIWLGKFWILIDDVEPKQYLFLISFSIILSSFILNLYFINKNTNSPIIPFHKEDENNNFIWENIHHFLHLVWMWIMWLLLLKIIPSTGHGWSLLWISIFITILWYFYSKFNFTFLKIFFLILIWWFWLYHIISLNIVFGKLEFEKLEYFKIIQYIVSAIIISNIFIWKGPHLASPKGRGIYRILIIIISLYLFIISNLFVLDLFFDIFKESTLTIYWGLIASGLLVYWIQKDLIKYRTIWLYFLALTSAKIFLFDVWQIANTNSRVAVFAILWVIFIIISTLYTKRFWDNLLWEFSLSNLKSENNDLEEDIIKNKEEKINKQYIEENNDIEDGKEENPFMKKLKKVDIEDIKVVRFFPKSWEKFTIRAKNLIRVSKLIIEKTWKTSFKSGELQNMYDFVIKNYKSDLSRREYDKIRSTVKDFIISGWEVELVKK